MHVAQSFADATNARDPGELREIADAHGHMLLRGLVPEALVAQVRDAVLGQAFELGWLRARDATHVRDGAALTGTGYDDPRWLELQQKILIHPDFRSLGTHPGLLEVLRSLYGEDPMVGRGDICRLAFPNALGLTTPPHQDHYYVGGSQRIWTAWIPLTDCPVDLGPLAVWPGSHRGGLLPHAGEGAGRQGIEAPSDAPWASEDLQPGDVVFFHCLTVHRALDNMAEARIRISADYRFQPASESVDTRRMDGSYAGPG